MLEQGIVPAGEIEGVAEECAGRPVGGGVLGQIEGSVRAVAQGDVGCGGGVGREDAPTGEAEGLDDAGLDELVVGPAREVFEDRAEDDVVAVAGTTLSAPSLGLGKPETCWSSWRPSPGLLQGE